MRTMDDKKVMELFELCGHVLDNQERLILSNLLMNYRTPAQLARFLNMPKIFVVKKGKHALQKIRDECINQLREAGAPEDLLQETTQRFKI